MWAEASGLTFKQVDRDADMELWFVRGWHGDGQPFDGPGRVVAHAYLPYGGGNVHFDNDETFTEDASGGGSTETEMATFWRFCSSLATNG